MALVREARRRSVSRSRDTTYVIYDRDVIDGTPHVMVYVTNDEGQSGYLIGDLDGRRRDHVGRLSRLAASRLETRDTSLTGFRDGR